MSNFAFLPRELRAIAEAATGAEGHIIGDPRATCFHARFALEAIVHWLYRHASSLRMPYDQSLGALLHEPAFQNLLPQTVFQKARLIQKVGNQAVHNPRPVRQYDALQAVKELHHLCFWLVRTYVPAAARDDAVWQNDRIPQPLIEMIIDQLTARGVMEASALYEPPFSDLHAGGPDELFSGRDHVFDALRDLHSGLATTAA